MSGDVHHIGRHWPREYTAAKIRDERTLESRCPCPKQPCGLVADIDIDPECPQHALSAAKTMRAGHLAADCPGAP